MNHVGENKTKQKDDLQTFAQHVPQQSVQTIHKWFDLFAKPLDIFVGMNLQIKKYTFMKGEIFQSYFICAPR